ncbi:hypothetical protein BC567DRAFT_215887 [Phyllosticta citribraziliensis]
MDASPLYIDTPPNNPIIRCLPPSNLAPTFHRALFACIVQHCFFCFVFVVIVIVIVVRGWLAGGFSAVYQNIAFVVRYSLVLHSSSGST